MDTRRLVLLIVVASAAPVHAQRPTSPETIDVIGTPLHSALDPNEIAANVQTATAEEIRERGATTLADFLMRDLASVFVNDAQSNPLQPDLQYRGFVGSPLLGLPQGLAVYQDGVRVNEPFGDTVNWALIPESAIDSVYLMPGSNPLFGLNALGGAISIRTKTGFSSPGTRAELLAGSFGRRAVQAETGGAFGEDVSYFVTGSRFDEDGWRDFSPSEATQLFANIGVERGPSTVDVGVSYVDTDLIGNGAAPLDLLEIDRDAVFTRPDRTQNELMLVNVRGTRAVADALTLRGNLYLRSSDIRTLNGDDSDYEQCEGDPRFICEVEDGGEELTADRDGNPIPVDSRLEGATINRTKTEQDGAGFGIQAAWSTERDARNNQFVVGLAVDASDIAFDSSTELGALDATRLAVPGGAFVGEAFTGLEAQTENIGFYLSATLSLSERAALTLSGRYNRTAVDLEDRLGEELTGEHDFRRFNPSVGILYTLAPQLGFYLSYSESNRAPSPIELTCADEDDPCRLPNAFLADPPLEQVVANTFEAGLRGTFANGRWHLGVFRTTNDDDILFISAGAQTNRGFFDNVGTTRRDGFELDFGGDAGERVSWSLSYTYLDATFRTSFAVPSPNNPGAVGGEIAVETGDRLPLVPTRLLKGGIRVAATDRLGFGIDAFSASDQYLRGDEGNAIDPIGDYTVVSVRASYRFGENAQLFFTIDNALDEEYETFGVFGDADDVLGEAFEDPRFLGPGAPRSAAIGVRLDF